MALHPTAEAYRQARAAGDDVAASSALIQAHSGTYNENLIDQIHQVGRMTRAELNAPADAPAETGPREVVRVTTRVFGRL